MTVELIEIAIALVVVVGTWGLGRAADKHFDSPAPRQALSTLALAMATLFLAYAIAVQQDEPSPSADDSGSRGTTESPASPSSTQKRSPSKSPTANKTQAEPSPVTSATETASPSEPSTQTPSPTPSDSQGSNPASPSVVKPSAPSPTPVTTPSTPAPRVYYLATVVKLAMEKEGRPGGCTGGCTGFNAGAGRIAGVTYPNSWLMEADASGARSTTNWNAALSCTRLQGTLGLSDSTSSTRVIFTLAVNGGAPVEVANVGSNEPANLDVDFSTVGEFQIAAYLSSAADDEADIVLGDLRATCVDGSLATY